MGASQSSEPRSVSMDNPNPAGVIDVSDDVVQRLKMGITKQVKENVASEQVATSKPAQQQNPKQETRAIPVKTTPAPAPPLAARAPTTVYSNQVPTYVQTAPGTTITALEMRRQKEIELQQNDAMWRQRMAQLELMLKKTNDIMENEYSTAVDDVQKRFANAAPVHQLPPCQDLKAQVIVCYRAHPGETLKCAEEVAAFRNCVSMHRVKQLDEFEVKPQPQLEVQTLAKASAEKPVHAG